MIETIWTYQVKNDMHDEFERRYAADGDWAKLFRRSPGYQGTSLLKDVREPDRYATIDRWTSVESLERFKKDFGRDYELLDRICGELTVGEDHVGIFESE